LERKEQERLRVAAAKAERLAVKQVLVQKRTEKAAREAEQHREMLHKRQQKEIARQQQLLEEKGEKLKEYLKAQELASAYWFTGDERDLGIRIRETEWHRPVTEFEDPDPALALELLSGIYILG